MTPIRIRLNADNAAARVRRGKLGRIIEYAGNGMIEIVMDDEHFPIVVMEEDVEIYFG